MRSTVRLAGLPRLAVLCFSLLLIVPTARAEDKLVARAATAVGATQPAQSTPSNNIDEYEIGPQDLLDISVFRVDELSRTVRVNSRGQITLPLIGAIQAGGLTAQQLEEVIAKKLSESYLQDPQVSVFIKEFVSQRVIIEGAVAKAGVYALSGRTTLLQAVAMASGLDDLANENEIRVFRESKDGPRTMKTYDLEAIRAGRADDPVIKGNDIVVVDKSGSRSIVKGITDTLRGFVGFGMR